MTDLGAIRMLVADLDGTLVGDGEQISPGVRSALAEARAAGIRVVIATGRRWRRTRSVIERLGGGLPAVCQGGALTKCERGNTLLASTLPADVCARLGAIFAAHEQTFIGQRDESDGGGDFVVDQSARWNDWTARYVERNRRWASLVPGLAGQLRGDVLTAAAFGEAAPLFAAQRRIERELAGEVEAVVMSGFDGAPFCLQVVRARATKWDGLAPILEREGVRAEQVCAVGDEVNDLSMIRAAGFGVAMGNASDTVRAAADWSTRSISEDGVAAVVERLLARR